MMKIFTGSSSSTNHQTDQSRNQSPKGLRPFDLGEVGLGIVAALDPTWVPANQALFSRNLSRRSKQVPIKSSEVSKEIEMNNDSSSFDEEYTVVTCRDPKESSSSYNTKVYFNNNNNNNNNNGGEHGGRTRIKNHDQRDFRTRASVFHISPANNVDSSSAGEFPTWDFLSSCSMCRKKLHGQDIYMYRGEKAFCSTECRYDQIVIDERKEKYYMSSKEASRQAAVVGDVSSSSPYVNGQKQMCAAGIVAT